MATGVSTAAGEVQNVAPPCSVSRALQSAVDLMSQSKFSRALALGAAAEKLPGCKPLAARLATLRLVCRLHLSSSQRSTTPWQVLGLEESASSASIRRAFRKGAQRIHPDKCDLPGAEAAFKMLAAAADTALAESRGSVSSNNIAASRGPSPDGPSAFDSDWWDEFETIPAEERQPERNSKRERTSSFTGAAAAGGDAEWLSNLTTKDLKAEVVRRQAAVFQRSPHSEEAAMDPLACQSRLREARTLLSDRIKADKARQLGSMSGGFCKDALPNIGTKL